MNIERVKKNNDLNTGVIFFNQSSHLGYPCFLLQNKSAFLCGVMKTCRQREKQGTKVSDSAKGPDESKIKGLLDRTNYTLDVTTGQRKYGGPPPESVYSGIQPTIGTEVPAPLYFLSLKDLTMNHPGVCSENVGL